MAFKYFVVLLAVLCTFQLFASAARLTPRSADEATPSSSDVLANAGETVTKTLESWKEGIENLFKEAPSLDSLVANVTSNFQKLSDQVEQAGKGLVDSLTATTVAP